MLYHRMRIEKGKYINFHFKEENGKDTEKMLCHRMSEANFSEFRGNGKYCDFFFS